MLIRSFRVLLALLVLLISPLFFVGGPDWVSADIIRQLWNCGHIAFFAALTLLLHQYISLAHWHRWLLLTVSVLIIGIVIEFIQGAIGRHKSWQDVLYNLAGVWLGLFWFLTPSPRVWVGRVFALIAFSPAAMNVAVAAKNYAILYQQIPIMSSFESAADMQQLHFNAQQVQITQSIKHVAEGKFSAELTLNTGRYSGVRMSVAIGDWTSYQQLKMNFFNPEQDLLIVMLRISDKQHDRGANSFDDRFNLLLTLKPGLNEVVIPLSKLETAPKTRKMNMAEISSLGIFASNLQEPRKLYWDYIYLD